MLVFRVLVGTLLTVSLLTGCGGGSSGTSSIKISSPPLAAISASKGSGQALADIDFSGTISGDVNSLAGKAVFVVVEDPYSLFSASPSLSIDPAGTSYHFVMFGKPLTTPGHFQGNLRISVCLDRTCQQPLPRTPIVIPFDVTVQAAVTLSRTQVNVTVPFGTLPPLETVGVSYFSAFPGWYVGRSASWQQPPDLNVFVQAGPQPLNTGSEFQILLKLGRPGIYRDEFRVNTIGVFAPNSTVDPTVAVSYTITPNPDLDYVFYPAAMDFVQKRSTTPVNHSVELITNTGVSASSVGVEYLSGAGTTGPATNWYSGSTATCSNQVSDATCLATGVYKAQIRYRVTTAAGTRDVLYPMTMTVID